MEEALSTQLLWLILIKENRDSSFSHFDPVQMAIIFSAEDLKDVKPPCVIQSFINHNAVLYKVFVIGESHTVVERPSLKNFPSGPSGKCVWSLSKRYVRGKGCSFFFFISTPSDSWVYVVMIYVQRRSVV